MFPQVLRQFLHRHPIDPGSAPVLSHPRQRRPDVAARDHLFHQLVASRAHLSARQRRRFAAALDSRGFTPPFQRQSQLLGLLAPGVVRTHGGSLSLPFGPLPARLSRPCPLRLATTASADFSLRFSALPFRHRARSPQVRLRDLPRTTAGSTQWLFGRQSFAVSRPLALNHHALYPVPVRRLAVSLHASSRPHLAVTPLRFACARRGLLTQRTFTS